MRSDGASAAEVESLLHRIGSAATDRAAAPPGAVVEAWRRLVDELLEPGSALRRRLQPRLLRSTGLSAPGLQAGLQAAVAGLGDDDALELLRRSREQGTAARPRPPALTVLAANIPGLALQSLLPALARRRAMLLKVSARDDGVTALLLERLGALLPGEAFPYAATRWPSNALDAAGASGAETGAPEVAGRGCDPWLVYGDRETIDAYRTLAERLAPEAGRAPELLLQGPRISAAILAREHCDDATLRGLARDVALFDQRGCLSVHAVLTDGDPHEIGRSLADALRAVAGELPVGPAALESASELQTAIALAEMDGLAVEADPRWGAVVVDADGTPGPGPGLRTVRVHRVAEPAAAARRLASLRGHLQGIALAAAARVRRALEPELAALGVSRVAAPGALQRVDARWANGGVDLFERFG